MFDTVPPSLSPLKPQRFCNCQAKPEPGAGSQLSACSRHGNVRVASVIPALDVTAQYTGSAELLKRPQGRTRQINPPDPSQRPSRGRRQPRRSVPDYRRPRRADSSGFGYFFPEDHEEAIQTDSPPSWPTPSGLTEERARARCRRAVANSSVALACARLLPESVVGGAVGMCVHDLQLKDELSWLNATLPLLENECERRLLEDWRKEEEHRDVVSALRCPQRCHGNGQCSDWGCVCFPGFGSYDCSVLSGNALNIL